MAIGPTEFTARCLAIVTEMRGHEAHHALDILTNEVLREQGFGDGIATFEAAVAHWHQETHPYPHKGPCPDCEAA
jgi:hypothetical protein